MKRIVALLAITAIAGSLSVAAFAQQPGPAGGKNRASFIGSPGGPGGMMGRPASGENEILAKLSLTPAQKKKLDALNKSIKEKLDAVMTARRESFIKILTPAQQAKYKALLKERDKRMKMRPAGVPTPPTRPRGKAKP